MWIITVFETMEHSPIWECDTGGIERVGLFHDGQEACDALESNACNIWDTCYRYATLEHYDKDGLYVQPETVWLFEYDPEHDRYRKIDIPAWWGSLEFFGLAMA